MQENIGYKKLVNGLVQQGVLHTPGMIKAFQGVDRASFVRPKYLSQAYADAPLPIGQGQTISQPYTVAFMLELLSVQPGQKVLDVGCGSGWTTALLAHIAGPAGFVWGLEHRTELVRFAQENLTIYPILAARVSIVEANGYQGLREKAPFDRILVSAAAASIPPDLVGQLAINGRMVIPIGEPHGLQTICLIVKDRLGQVSEERFPGFVFVPLTNKI